MSKNKEYDMNIIQKVAAHPTQDGDGVKISRIHDFRSLSMDPFLMIDEIRSDDQADYLGGFPPHPHRGIETFTYMIKGGFEHRDQMGNVKAIRSGDVQWMSTGYGVVHSEMPLLDEGNSLHGFQIWLNMPAKDKLRPAIYQDTVEHGVSALTLDGGEIKALAGSWSNGTESIESELNNLAGNAGIADLSIEPSQTVSFPVPRTGRLMLLVHSGKLQEPEAIHGTLLQFSDTETLTLTASEDGFGGLIFYGEPINEQIAHMGPFVMNTEAELHQAVRDYQSGKFGQLSV